MTSDALSRFGRATREWFTATFPEPTAAQAAAWQAITARRNALVVAPTGSGKTLSAFLWALDRLVSEPPPDDPVRRCRVLYVSPLKALAHDVERNLREPLAGIGRAAEQLGLPVPSITTAMRTGDTPADERRRFARRPTDILITTPESLYLLLTSAAREALRGVDTVIVDEVHAVCGTKRGAHLALSLERLDALLPVPAQRIGLSATVRPIEETARFLGGEHPVEIVRPKSDKRLSVSVEVTVDDLANLTDVDDRGAVSVWPSVVSRLHALVTAHRSTIVFVNARALAERLCARLNEFAAGTPVPDRSVPAHLSAQSEVAAGAPAVLARAHHGSMSREERQEVESGLKTGRLRAVVATSSLELGIDMGAVDLVVQIGAPPSVSAGVQRIGRAGHRVGAVSSGVVLPTHRSDLLAAAVTASRVATGRIEELRPPRNPVDVLAQQIVAMVAMDDWRVPELARLVRRAAPFASLTDAALRSVLDMLSGRYPSTEFAGLRPKLVWHRDEDRLATRRGAHRVAILDAGTIPDRGMYGVFLTEGGTGSRVGELDEEMIHESRVGDVFVLGATSWRIDEITPDRVLVSPAPGRAARMPFWKGEDPGRPAELGRAIGRLVADPAGDWTRTAGLDPRAAANLTSYVAAQREATGVVCDDRTVVMERFRDELGDWRLVVHCLLGARVNRPWGLAIAARLRDRFGIDGHLLATDDGIMIRLPDMAEPPGAELVTFDSHEIATVVTAELTGSALFAARFRECAARALLLPRRGFGKRQPLWQQRQRAGQLFEVARRFEDFPITAEAARECLQEYFDLPQLSRLMAELADGSTRVVEVTTPRPSPFAHSILSGYVAGNLYGEDEPMAERRAAALDSGLLGELIGEPRDELDPDVVARAVDWLAWRDGRPTQDPDDVVELLRVVGDLSRAELADRGVPDAVVMSLLDQGRVVGVELAGRHRLIAVEDAARYRDGLAVALPAGIPADLLTPTVTPLDDLMARYARTHGPFTTARIAGRFGLDIDVAEAAMHRLTAAGTTTRGRFTSDDRQWCSTDVLRLLRRRTLAALRAEIAPVDPARYVAFGLEWQRVGDTAAGVDAVADVLAQLQGCPAPASAWESLILPARTAEYQKSHLDELTASGELLWAGNGSLPGSDGWIIFCYADTAADLLPPADETVLTTALHRAVVDSLGHARFFRDLADLVEPDTDTALVEVLWELVWGGWISNDSLAPLRARLSGPATTAWARGRRPARPRFPGGYATTRPVVRTAPPTAAGRWYRLPDRQTDPTRRAHAAATAMLDRHGIVVRGVPAGRAAGFAGSYPVLAAMEETGAVRRGYFVAGLGAAQFAEPGAVDRLRSAETGPPVVLSVCDPANPFGLGMAWPSRPDDSGGHRPGRRAGAAVVLVDGIPAWYLERGGHTVLTHTTDAAIHRQAAEALAGAMSAGRLPSEPITHVDGSRVLNSPIADPLRQAGFRDTPRGLRLP